MHGVCRNQLWAGIFVSVSVFSFFTTVYADEPVALGSRRELFVDRLLIEKLDGVELRLHEPNREGVALKFDRPWEGAFSCYTTVFRDGNLYRMYYRGLPMAGKDESADSVVCYAESADGIHWIKPNLRLFSIKGTLDNNIVLTNAPFAHNFSPFLDAKPDVPPGEKYKALAGLSHTGLHAFKSADGIHWEKWQAKAVFTNGIFDSQNVSFWSAQEQQYLCYFRTWKKLGEGFRWISRTTSKDFSTWTDPEEMEFGSTPPEHLYTNGTHPYFRAPHIYIGLAKRFFPKKSALPAGQAKELVSNPAYRVASSDSIFMTTRGGRHYERAFMEAFIRPGPDPEDWVSRDNTPALGVVPGTKRQMYVYRGSHYAQLTAHMARYSLRTDGFVSASSSYQGGELLTRPFTFSGTRLEINFVTSAAGGIRIEVQDLNGQPFPGFSLQDCPEKIGDEIDRVVSWKGGDDLSQLAGKTVRLRIALKDADLYSFRFF